MDFGRGLPRAETNPIFHITKLNKKIAYQRPCISRYAHDLEPMLDELFQVIGVHRVARKYDRQDALCCGSLFMDKDPERGLRFQERIDNCLYAKSGFACPTSAEYKLNCHNPLGHPHICSAQSKMLGYKSGMISSALRPKYNSSTILSNAWNNTNFLPLTIWFTTF